MSLAPIYSSACGGGKRGADSGMDRSKDPSSQVRLNFRAITPFPSSCLIPNTRRRPCLAFPSRCAKAMVDGKWHTACQEPADYPLHRPQTTPNPRRQTGALFRRREGKQTEAGPWDGGRRGYPPSGVAPGRGATTPPPPSPSLPFPSPPPLACATIPRARRRV